MPNRVTLRSLRSAQGTLRSSFLAYLDHAKPYVAPGEDGAQRLLEELIGQQQGLATRVGGHIRELGGEEAQSDFPAEFTAAHDLAIEYAMQRAAQDQRQRVERLTELREEQADNRTDELFDDIVHLADAIADQLERAAQEPLSQPANAT